MQDFDDAGMRLLFLTLMLLVCCIYPALAESNDMTGLNHASAMIAYNDGLRYDSLGEIANATAAYRRAVGLDPEFAEAWYNLGMALYAVSDKFDTYNQAYECFTKAIDLNPKLDAWNGDGLRPMQVNSKEDWDYWKQLHAL